MDAPPRRNCKWYITTVLQPLRDAIQREREKPNPNFEKIAEIQKKLNRKIEE